MDEAGHADEKKIKEHLRTHYKDDAWQLKVLDDVVDICMAEVATKVALTNKTVTETNATQKCNPTSSIFTHCLWRQMTTKCPAEHQDQSQHCQRMREKFTKKGQQNVDATKPEPPKVSK